MAKEPVLVDTVFINRLSENGKDTEQFKKVMTELNYMPILHPYLAEHELEMFGYVKVLIDEGFIQKAKYDDFLHDEEDRQYYQELFVEIHNLMREYLDARGSKKRLKNLQISQQCDVFTYRNAGMSLGDVHLVLMAFFMKLPIILTEDSDIELLRSITQRKMGSSSYQLNIYNIVDILIKIAESPSAVYTKKELTEVARKTGNRKQESLIKAAWNVSHAVN